ncbi:MAG: hypothetical protein HY259_03375 [Chloroflexi bacterium]|nr:hypothetical protein [Chloroflexota bacterium]
MSMITHPFPAPPDEIGDRFSGLAFGFRQGRHSLRVTSGSYTRSYPATLAMSDTTGNWPAPAAVPDGAKAIGRAVLVTSAGERTALLATAEPTTAHARTERDLEMLALEAAARAGDERAFLAALDQINWLARPPEYYIRAVRLALEASAHLAARRLAAEGAERYRDHTELQKYARVLAPPRVTRSNLPPDPTIKANLEWLKANRDRYLGQWVALQGGKLLAAADHFDELIRQVSSTKGVLLTVVY